MVDAGANPMQVLCFAMSAAADLLGIGDEAGTLEPGKPPISWPWPAISWKISRLFAKCGWGVRTPGERSASLLPTVHLSVGLVAPARARVYF